LHTDAQKHDAEIASRARTDNRRRRKRSGETNEERWEAQAAGAAQMWLLAPATLLERNKKQ